MQFVVYDFVSMYRVEKNVYSDLVSSPIASSIGRFEVVVYLTCTLTFV